MIRRDFLKLSALGSSSLLLSSCSTVDRYFMGDQKNLKNEVVILGAGAAGLAAANALKTRRIPYRVFEASSRIGGRVQSLHIDSRPGPVAEMGAEFFDYSHAHIFRWAKELSLTVEEVKPLKGLEAHFFSFDGKSYRVKDLASRMKTLSAPFRRVRRDLYHNQNAIITHKNILQFEQAIQYDNMSLQDLLTSWSREVDPLILKLIEVQSLQRFGLESSEQSALMFLSTLDSEGSSLLVGRPIFRMQGGLDSLMMALYRRAAGVIPDYLVKMNCELVELSESNDVFELTFKTPRGQERYQTQHVICTLPFSVLKSISGLESMRWLPAQKAMIQEVPYGTHTKATTTFARPFWRQTVKNMPGNMGNFTGNFHSQKIWDSGRGQDTEKGLLTLQRGGKSSEQAGPQVTADLLRDLRLFYPSLSAEQIENSEMVNWKNKKWARGSVLSYHPGQYTKYNGLAGESSYDGRFLFAGEHTSLQAHGTLQGALDSGLRAATAIVKSPRS